MPTAGEFCNRRVIIATGREPLVEAARRMYEEHVGSVVVVDEVNGKRIPIGMVTDRDIVLRWLADWSDQHFVSVADVMTSSLVTATEREDLADVCARMRAFGIRRVPVVDEEGVLQGIITFDDVIEWASERMGDLARLLTRERESERARESRSPGGAL